MADNFYGPEDLTEYYRLSKNSRQKPRTNADRIRAMSDNEMASWIAEVKITGCPEDQISTMWCDVMSCADCWLDWLKQEAADKDSVE